MSQDYTPENLALMGDVYQHKAPGDRVQRIVFRSERGAQSAEMNDLQEILLGAIEGLGGAVFTNGKVITGAVPVLNAAFHLVNISPGTVYFDGFVNTTLATALTIPWDKKVFVGIQFRRYIFDEVDDPNLRDPAVASENFGQPGAARVRGEWVWGWQADDGTDDGRTDPPWSFYPVWTIDHGVLVVDSGEVVIDPNVELIAKYDREAHGNYIVDGNIAAFVVEDNAEATFSLKAGTSDIYGHKVLRKSDARLVYPKDFDEREVENEFHTFIASGGVFNLFTNYSPISSVGDIIGIRQATDGTIGHPIAGGMDQIHPTRSVSAIISVRYNDTGNLLPGMTHVGTWVTFTQGVHYHKTGNNVNWSDAGFEVPVGHSYEVVYQYSEDIIPDAINVDHIVLSGLVEGSTIILNDYKYKLPRVDLLVLNRDGSVERLKGTPQLRNPFAPKASANQIAIAEIIWDWVRPPVVRNIGVRSIPFFELKALQERVEDMFDILAQNELRFHAALEDPTAKYGVFVDPFTNDGHRDTGVAQTAAIVSGVLTLPITPTIGSTSAAGELAKFYTLPFNNEAIIIQNRKSGQMKINPYQAFEPFPCSIILQPPTDVWTEFQSSWASPATAVFWGAATTGVNATTAANIARFEAGRNLGRIALNQVTTQSVVTLAQESVALQFVRERTVAFDIEGFGPGEVLTSLTFDGLDVTPA